MKLLFTSVGRRVELLQAFRNAAGELNMELILYGADMDDTAPALQFCDHAITLPPIRTEEYIPVLLDLCRKERIDALIPTIDTDLLILAENKKRFREIGTTVVISEPDRIGICRDKRKTARFFEKVGLFCPKPVDDVDEYNAGFPAFIKPKDGSASIFAYKVENEEELQLYSEHVPDYIIQPFVNGTEYTVDVLCDLEGNPILITPRIRLSVRGGEVMKTRISQDVKIIEETKKILEAFCPCGPVTLQLMREEKTGEDYYIEINPRFGGGTPLSIKAGADSAKELLCVLLGRETAYIPFAAEDGAVFSRFDQSVRIR